MRSNPVRCAQLCARVCLAVALCPLSGQSNDSPTTSRHIETLTVNDSAAVVAPAAKTTTSMTAVMATGIAMEAKACITVVLDNVAVAVDTVEMRATATLTVVAAAATAGTCGLLLPLPRQRRRSGQRLPLPQTVTGTPRLFY